MSTLPGGEEHIKQNSGGRRQSAESVYSGLAIRALKQIAALKPTLRE
jgi:hypothetical protein